MPKIHRIRIVGLKYDGMQKQYKDTTFHFHNEKTVHKWSDCDDEWGRKRGIPANDFPNP